MKIKEAAARTNLSEKAIRFYEAKHLITPQTRQLNGRHFREYTEENVRDLLMIAALRRAYFSIGQIQEMLADERRCAAVFEEYRTEQTALYREMTPLVSRLESVDGASITSLEALVKAIDGADEEAPKPRELHFHRHEDISDEEKNAMYRAFLKHQRRRDRRDAVLSRVGGALKWLLLSACVLFGIFFVLWILDGAHTNTSVEFTLEAIEWKEYDEDYCIPRTITFTGKETRYLFRPDYGTFGMSVSGYTPYDPLNEDEFVGTIFLSLQTERGYHRPAVIGGRAIREDGVFVTMMEVYIDDARQMGYIVVYETQPDGTTVYDPRRGIGSILSFSVKNREDAEAVYRFFSILKYRSW